MNKLELGFAFLKTLTLVFLFSCFSSNALADDFPLLRLSKNNKSVFLIGSQHVGQLDVHYESDINRLVENSNAICVENDPADQENISDTSRVVFISPNGESLKEIIGEQLYEKSRRHLNWYISKGYSIDNISPYFLSNLITANFPRLGDFMAQMKPNLSIDFAIKESARKYNKIISNIEDKDAVKDSFSSLKDEEWKVLIEGIISIADCRECRINYAQNMIKAYDPVADFESSHQYFEKAFNQDKITYRLFNRIFFSNRNSKIAKNIEDFALRDNKCTLIAIGAGHLGGAEGVVSILRKDGVTVEVHNKLKK